METHCKYDYMTKTHRLKPHPKNANVHSKEQIERLAKILKYQGWRHPIVVSKNSFRVVAGHGRLEAAKLNEWEEVPVVHQVFKDDDQEYAFLISDNAVQMEYAELSLPLINQDFTDLDPDFDLELLGLKDFKIEPLDKLDATGDVSKKEKVIICPSCETEFTETEAFSKYRENKRG